MLKKLIIVESPAKCKKIKGFLDDSYSVIASYGHINKLKSYNPKKDFNCIFEIISNKQIMNLKKAIDGSNKIIIATDDDREGEFIGYQICKHFNLPLNTERIIFHEITKTAIINALQNPSVINLNIANSANARQVIDMVVGYNISPVLWRDIGKSALSAGRCQTPALRLIYDNHKKIESTPLKLSYLIKGYFTDKNIEFTLTNDINNPEDFLNKSISFNHVFYKSPITKCTHAPPQPFTTSRLQQVASNILNSNVKNTMTICQKLYEQGYITYMRTDSKTYSKDFIDKVKPYIKLHYNESYINKNIDNIKGRSTKSKNAQEAHEAIRPTDISRISLSKEFNAKEKKMYQLIYENTLESCMSDSISNVIPCYISAPDNQEYNYKAEKIVFLGWKIVKNKSPDDSLYHYINLLDKQSVNYNTIDATIKVNNFISHYTEANIVKLLEQHGIGRPSTYANIINKIQEKQYVKLTNIDGIKIKEYEYTLKKGDIIKKLNEKQVKQEKNKLIIQPLGILVIEYLLMHFDALFDYKYTETMEAALDDVVCDRVEWKKICHDCYDMVKSLLKQIKKEKREYKIDDNHTWVIQRYGPVIKCSENDTITWKKVKPDLDLKKLENNEYTLKDVLLEEKDTSIGEINNLPVKVKKGRYGLYATWGDNTCSLKKIKKPIEDITIQDVLKCKTSSILCEIDDTRSIRMGKYGAYLFYKTAKMKKPQFISLSNYILDVEQKETWINLNKERFIDWLENK